MKKTFFCDLQNKYLLLSPPQSPKSSRNRRYQVSWSYLVILIKYCLHDASGKYVLQLIRETMHHTISMLISLLRKLVESFKLLPTQENTLPKKGEKRPRRAKERKEARTGLSLPGGI